MNNTKTIDELYCDWYLNTERGWGSGLEAFKAGHLQASKDSLELLKRAYDACIDNRDNPNDPTLCMELEDQIGYIEENIKQQ